MTTNFGTKIAINWFCLNDSDSATDYVGVSGRPIQSADSLLQIPCTQGTLLWQPVFGFLWAITLVV